MFFDEHFFVKKEEIFQIYDSFRIMSMCNSCRNSCLMSIIKRPESQFLMNMKNFVLRMTCENIHTFLFVFSHMQGIKRTGSVNFSAVFSDFLFVITLLRSVNEKIK